MGKQSARLYYNGEDCSDIYYGGYYNLSKIYKGNKLWWERLPPKYILASRNTLFTTEVLKALSTFRQYSLAEVYGVGYRGIEYIFGLYYMMLYVKETRESEPFIWLLNSENGYDWKKVYDLSDADAKDMRKYMGKLAFIAKKDTAYALCLMHSDLSIDYVFDTNQVIGMNGLNMLSAGDNIILLIDDDREYIVTIKNGEYAGIIRKTAFAGEEDEDVSLASQASYDQDDGYFYMDVLLGGAAHYIHRSKDGLSWTRFFYSSYTPLSNLLFDDNYIYYEGVLYSQSLYRLIRINKSDSSYEPYNFPGAGLCCIDNVFYFYYRDKIYKSQDLFNVTQSYSPESGYSLENADEVRTSDKHQWTMTQRGIPVFNQVCCTDENVKIYI